MSINKLEDFIVVIKKVIPIELCNSILNEYKNSNDWKDAGSANNNIMVIDKKTRNCQSIITSLPENLISNTIRSKLDDEIFNITAKCLKLYIEKFPTCKVSQDTGYDLLKYEKGGFYIQHTDSFFQRPREIACSLLLNDDFEGGEFAFFNRELKYKLNKGDVLMFPSNFMYPHEIMEVTEGTRYAIITWFR